MNGRSESVQYTHTHIHVKSMGENTRPLTGVHGVVHGDEDEPRVAKGGRVPAEEEHGDVVVPESMEWNMGVMPGLGQGCSA